MGETEKTKQERNITLKVVRMDDPEAQYDPPVPGTMAERLGLVWELTAEIVSLGGKMDAEQRLSRHVTHFVRGEG
jgi:hypothetical protein